MNRMQVMIQFIARAIILLLILGEASCALGQLSVEESVAMVFYPGGGSGACRAVHPEAREPLWRIIEDPTLKKYHDRAVHDLAFIAKAEDVRRLELLFHDGLPNLILARDASSGIREVPITLGHMARRRVKDSDSTLRKISRLTYWKEVMGADSDKLWVNIRLPSDLISKVCHGLALSEGNGANDRIRELIAEIPDKEWRLSVSRNWEGNDLDKFGKDQIAKIMKGEEWRQSVPWAVAAFNGNLKNPNLKTKEQFRRESIPDSLYLRMKPADRSLGDVVWGRNITDILSEDERAALAKEATEQLPSMFALLDEATLDRTLVQRLALLGDWAGRTVMTDGGGETPLAPRRDKLKKVVGEIQKKGIKPIGFEFWEEDWSGRHSFPVTDKKKRPKIVSVFFKLDGTAGVFDRQNYYVPDWHPTISDDGSAVVLMKKVDGKWYWNPFGW